MSSRTETISYSKLTICLLLAILLAAVAYVYFLNTSVVHVVTQKQVASNIHDLKSEIALLESSYIEAQHKISARMASVEGVTAERTKIFVQRQGLEGLASNQ